jgi:HAD superfamily hydrolase (TIGR01509 family)
MGVVNAADLDAVTLDAYGTLVRLRNPVPELGAALAERGQERSEEQIRAGFQAEVEYYREHSAEGHDRPGLERLQRDCAKVFLDAVGAEIDQAEFAPVYAGAMRFDVLPGVEESLERLRALGLELAVVANWDLSLTGMLTDAGLARFFRVVVHAARKPAPGGFLAALTELRVEPHRALHIGDDGADEQGAAAAGLHFAPAPVSDAVKAIA